MIFAFIIALGFALMFCMLDAHHSANGIKLGLFVEGNPMIVHFFGRRPTLKQLIIFGLTQLFILTIFAMIDPFLPGDQIEHPMMMISVSGLSVMAVKHYMGYAKARKFGA